MRKLHVLALMAMLVFMAQAARADDASETEVALRSSLGQMVSGAEEQARRLLEAMKQGNARAFLDLFDIEALHEDAAEEEGEVAKLAEFAKKLREAVEAEFKDGPAQGFEYEVVGSVTVVKVKVRQSKDAEWQEHEIGFVKEDGQWKISVEGMKAFDLGPGFPGGISRRGQTIQAAVKKMLEATRAGDFKTIAGYIDWKAIYDQIPEEMRGGKEFEDWKNEVIETAGKEVKPEKDFEYEILEVKEEGDTATVKVKTRENKDAEWREDTVKFKKVDGAWKTTMGSM